MKEHLSQLLMEKAPNNRHGICLEPQRALISKSDLETIIHYGVPTSVDSPWESASGGVGRNQTTALLASIGESVERYCATIVQLPLFTKQSIKTSRLIDAEEWCLFDNKQRQQKDFPFNNIYTNKCMYTNVFDFQNNDEYFIPHPMVALRDDYETGVPTSSGLAAGATYKHALLRATQELIERDALMVTWLHGIAGRSIEVPKKYIDELKKLEGEVFAFDLTPQYSPFPVIAVAGGIMKQGNWRYSLGIACREDISSAMDKAYLEWNQGIMFAGVYGDYVDTEKVGDLDKLKTFDEHAIFYTLNPELWNTLPLFASKHKIVKPLLTGTFRSLDESLKLIRKKFNQHKIRLYYRDLTTIDAQQLGLSVVRVASPDLAQIFAHQEWPLINRVDKLLTSRYPKSKKLTKFPNLMPHPLG